MKTVWRKSPGVIEVAAVFLGFVAAVVLLSLNSARAKSRDAKRLADIRQTASALELFFNDKRQYPEKLIELEPVYIGVLPKSPEPADGACSPLDNQYQYSKTSKETYQLSFCLGQTTGGYSQGKHFLSQKGIE
jgi:type II secretory pathway pseudopilin PulG